MIIQMNKISPNLTDTERKDVSVSAADVRDDNNISDSIWNYTRDCTVRKDTGKSSIYTEQQTRLANPVSVDDTDLPLAGGISPSAFITSCMTGEDIKDLSEEQTPLEEYTSSQLERAVSRVREQRTRTQESVDRQVSKEKDREDHLEEHLEEKVPETEENITRFLHAAELAGNVATLSEDAMKYFMSQGFGTITPQNIGTCAAASAYMMPEEQSVDAGVGDGTFDQVKDRVEKILTDGGVEVTDQSMDAAQYLYENDLAVTVEQVKTYLAMQELKEEDPEVLLARIVDAMAEGTAPEDVDLTRISDVEARSLVDSLTSVDDTTLRRTFTTEADFIRAKRQLEEIRLHMTADAARSMLARGIELDVSNLEEIVQDLRMQEQEASESLLAETGLEPGRQNAQIAGQTIRAAKQILAAPVEFLGTMRSYTGGQTLQEISDAAFEAALAKQDAAEDGADTTGTAAQSAVTGQISVDTARMQQAYETVGTQVRTDLGDRMSKAFRNVDDILQDYGLETTEANRRAVRILAYNRMPLTEESIVDMKAYDAKVTGVMKSLTPPVVAEMIRRRINPLDKTIDELADVTNEIREETGYAGDDESFARYLWKLDRMGAVTEKERQSMIGIYRLLDKVEKSDGSVIGQIVKEGKELTLSSLLSATRSRRAAGLDVSVDDDFGGLEEVVEKGTSISSQIMSAYGESVVSSLKKSLSPKILREYITDLTGADNDAGNGVQDISLESLLEQSVSEEAENPEMAMYYERIAQQIRAAAEDADGRCGHFLEMLEIPDTMANLAAAKQILSGKRGRYENLWDSDEADAVVAALDEPDELEQVYEKIDESHTAAVQAEQEADDITGDKLTTLVQMAGNISFYRNLRSHQMYEVPLVTENGVTTCHVTIQDGTEQKKGTVEITLDSETAGRIQATFRVSGARVRGFVTAETKEGLDASGEIMNEMEKDLEEMGFTTDGMSPVTGKRQSLLTGNRSEGAKNKDLYQIAKAFITRAGARM